MPMVLGILAAVLLAAIIAGVVVVRKNAGGSRKSAGGRQNAAMVLNPNYPVPARVNAPEQDQTHYLAPVTANPAYSSAKNNLQQRSKDTYGQPGELFHDAPGVHEYSAAAEPSANQPDYAQIDDPVSYAPEYAAAGPLDDSRGAPTDYDVADDATGADRTGRGPRAEYASGDAEYLTPVALPRYALFKGNGADTQYATHIEAQGAQVSRAVRAGPTPAAWTADGTGRSAADVNAIYTTDNGERRAAPPADLYALPSEQDNAAVWTATKVWLDLAVTFTKADAESLLSGSANPGSFLIRSKTGGGGGRVLSVRTASSKVVHYRIDELDGMFTLLDTKGAEIAYTSLEGLVRGHVHTGTTLPADGVALSICVPPPATATPLGAAGFVERHGSMPGKPSVHTGFDAGANAGANGNTEA